MEPTHACSGCAENPAGPFVLGIALVLFAARLVGWIVTRRRMRAFLAAGNAPADASSARDRLPA